MTAWPRGVWETSGWNCTEKSPRSRSSMPATGIASVVAVMRNPSGARVTASPCDIQTVSLAGRSRSRVPGSVTCSWVAPYSRSPVASTSPPSAWAMSWWP